MIAVIGQAVSLDRPLRRGLNFITLDAKRAISAKLGVSYEGGLISCPVNDPGARTGRKCSVSLGEMLILASTLRPIKNSHQSWHLHSQ